MEFCHGHSAKMSLILKTYSGITEEDTQEGLRIQTRIFLVGLGLNAIELILYANMFRDLYRHNISMIGMLSRDIIHRRIKSNVITLGGQAVIFVIEIIANIVLIVLINLFTARGFDQGVILPVTFSILSAVLSVIELLSSPELKNHLKVSPDFI